MTCHKCRYNEQGMCVMIADGFTMTTDTCTMRLPDGTYSERDYYRYMPEGKRVDERVCDVCGTASLLQAGLPRGDGTHMRVCATCLGGALDMLIELYAKAGFLPVFLEDDDVESDDVIQIAIDELERKRRARKGRRQ